MLGGQTFNPAGLGLWIETSAGGVDGSCLASGPTKGARRKAGGLRRASTSRGPLQRSLVNIFPIESRPRVAW